MHYNTMNADWKITSQPLPLAPVDTVFQTSSPSNKPITAGDQATSCQSALLSRLHNI